MVFCNAFLMLGWGWGRISVFEEIVEFGLEEWVIFVILEDVFNAAGEKCRIIDAVLIFLGNWGKLPDGA